MGLGFKPMGMCDAATFRKKGIRGQVIAILLTTWSSLLRLSGLRLPPCLGGREQCLMIGDPAAAAGSSRF